MDYSFSDLLIVVPARKVAVAVATRANQVTHRLPVKLVKGKIPHLL